MIAAALAVLPQAVEHSHQVRSTKSEVLLTSNFVLEVAQRPVTLRPEVGSAHDAAGTASKPAQAFFDQGLAYLHSYVWLEAARSFNQALRIDPKLALAHVGLTVAYVELNAPA